MKRWITCNLPWRSCFRDEDFKEPDLDVEQIAKFGMTEEQALNKVLAPPFKVKLKHNKMQYALKIAHPRARYVTINRLLNEKIMRGCDSALKNLQKMHILWREIADWTNKHPVIKQYEKEYTTARAAAEKNSFVGQGLNQPGTLIELSDGQQRLIGHLNQEGGTCSEGAPNELNPVVARYRVVWRGDGPK
jgi:hypothetical protein